MTDITLVHQRTVAGVRFHRVGKLYHFDYSAFPELQLNDYVIVETARGRQMGQIVSFTAYDEDSRDYKPIMRPATPRDLTLKQHWEMLQDEALDQCIVKAKQIGGFQETKFIAAHYNFDGSVITFLFTAEDKLNTSRLGGELGKIFPMQVELRQIGPRDVA